MKKERLFELLKEVFETSVSIDENTVLKNIPEYSSLTNLALIAFMDESFNKKITYKDLNNIITVADLMAIIGNENIE